MKLNILSIQLLLIIPLFFILLFFEYCIIACNSIAYGVLVSLSNAAVVLIVSIIASRIATNNPKAAIALAFGFGGVRFVMIGALFYLGIKWLNLAALPMLISFAGLHLTAALVNFGLNIIYDNS